MKTIKLFWILLFIPFTNHAQDWDWMSSWGSTESDFASRGMVFDDEFIYVSGAFEGVILTDVDTLISEGGRDAIITKLNKTTGEIIWQRGIGGPSTDGGDAIGMDDAGYIYHFGFFKSILEVNGQNIFGAGGYDIFIAKYDSAGNILWIKNYGETGNDIITHVEYTENNDFVFSGNFSETLTLGSTQLTSNGKADAMVGRIDTAGNFTWATSIGGPDDDRFFQAFPGPDGSIYANGDMKDTMITSVGILESAGFIDALVAKWDSAGTLLWARQGGGINTDQAVGGAVDEKGNFYIDGYFGLGASFGNILLNHVENQEGFVLKYNSDGVEQWGRTLNGLGGSYFYGIDYVNENTIYLSGKIEDSTSWGNKSWNTANETDIFLAKINDDGDLSWGAVMGGPKFESAFRVQWEDDYVYIQGRFEDTCYIGSHFGVSKGGFDGYVARRHFPVYPTNISDNNLQENSLSIYPNPNQGVFNITSETPINKKTELVLYDLNGRTVENWNINSSTTFPLQLSVPNLPSGMYFLNMISEKQKPISQKIMITR